MVTWCEYSSWGPGLTPKVFGFRDWSLSHMVLLRADTRLLGLRHEIILGLGLC